MLKAYIKLLAQENAALGEILQLMEDNIEQNKAAQMKMEYDLKNFEAAIKKLQSDIIDLKHSINKG